jgi:cytochrome c oxidase subunit II
VNFSQFLTSWILPTPVSTYGARIDSIYYLILWVTGIIFVATEVTLIYFAIKYRRKDGQKALYSHGNTKLEIVWTVIPALFLIYMGLASQTLWSDLRSASKFPANPLVIRVLGEQWLWHFKYAGEDGKFDTDDDLNVQNSFHIPVDTPVRFELASQDVIHGFFLPDLRLHQDAVPGLTSLLWVQVNKPGSYELRCTQFCGTNHYEMKGQLTVDSAEDYKTWMASAKAESF